MPICGEAILLIPLAEWGSKSLAPGTSSNPHDSPVRAKVLKLEDQGLNYGGFAMFGNCYTQHKPGFEKKNGGGADVPVCSFHCVAL